MGTGDDSGEVGLARRGSRLAALQGEARNAEPDDNKAQKARFLASKNTRDEVETEGREQYFLLRKHWSKYLMWALSCSMVFQVVLICLVGLGLLPFAKHEIFLNTVAGEIFLQIAGMCLIAVRCLFPSTEKEEGKKEKDALKKAPRHLASKRTAGNKEGKYSKSRTPEESSEEEGHEEDDEDDEE